MLASQINVSVKKRMKTMKTINRNGKSYSILAAALLLILWGGVQQAQAQWTTPDSNGNTGYNNGNVGVGTGASAPAGKLEVVNTSGSTDNPAGYFQITGTTGNNDNYPGISLKGGTLVNKYPFLQLGNGGLALTIGSGRDTSNFPNRIQLALSANSSGYGYAAFQLYNGSLTTNLFTVSDSGKVGIGTNSPINVLHTANGSSNTSLSSIGVADLGLVLQNTDQTANNMEAISFANNSSGGQALIGAINVGSSSSSGGRLFFATRAAGGILTERVRIDESGNVGIGTTTPASQLAVGVGTAAAGTRQAITIGNAGYAAPSAEGTTSNGDKLVFWNSASNLYKAAIGLNSSELWLQSSGNSSANKITFFTSNNSTTPVERMRIDSLGNVGIGRIPNDDQPATSYKLDIAGDVRVSGNLAAKYQDVAEWVPATHALAAGTVVILNPTKSNEVMASTSAYDTRVAGVVSEHPGLALGEASAEKALVATTGRVKVKVDARRSPIHIGDLLVTSDEEGVAMKSEPVDLGGVKIHRPGTLIGKALEPLESGTGEILVLLSLQ